MAVRIRVFVERSVHLHKGVCRRAVVLCVMPDAIDIICVIVHWTSRIVLEVIVVSGFGEVFGWRNVVGHAFTVPGCRISRGVTLYHGPVLGMLVQGSVGGSG